MLTCLHCADIIRPCLAAAGFGVPGTPGYREMQARQVWYVLVEVGRKVEVDRLTGRGVSTNVESVASSSLLILSLSHALGTRPNSPVSHS